MEYDEEGYYNNEKCDESVFQSTRQSVAFIETNNFLTGIRSNISDVSIQNIKVGADLSNFNGTATFLDVVDDYDTDFVFTSSSVKTHGKRIYILKLIRH